MNNLSKKLLLAFTSLTALALTGNAQPPPNATITWGGATTISGDSDVDTTGSLLYAYHFGYAYPGPLPDTTINGVTFQGIQMTFANPLSFGAGNTMTETTPGYSLGEVGLGGSVPAPFNNLSGSYKAMLSEAAFSNNASTVQLKLSGLTVGNQYEIQWWTNVSGDGWACPLTQATAGNSVTLNANAAGVGGGLGQFVTGSFTATSASETVNFDNVSPNADADGYGPVINGFELRDVDAVPEPSTWLLLTLGAPALVGMARMRRAKA